MVNSREKGKRGEREFSKEMRSLGFDEARRGVQYQGGSDSPDVVGIPGYHPEVKRVERININNAMKQSIDESGDGEVPIVAHKQNRKEWLVTMRLTDWVELIRKGE